MHSAMQLHLSQSPKQPNQLFAGALLAFSLLGSMDPHYWNTENGRYHENFVNQIQVQKNNHDSLYNPPRSPAFNDLWGS
jgi:hypothetical protein